MEDYQLGLNGPGLIKALNDIRRAREFQDFPYRTTPENEPSPVVLTVTKVALGPEAYNVSSIEVKQAFGTISNADLLPDGTSGIILNGQDVTIPSNTQDYLKDRDTIRVWFALVDTDYEGRAFTITDYSDKVQGMIDNMLAPVQEKLNTIATENNNQNQSIGELKAAVKQLNGGVEVEPEPTGPTIEGFYLLDAEGNQVLELTDGIEIDRATYGKMNIRAVPSEAVASVIFTLSGAMDVVQIESTPPFDLFGDDAKLVNIPNLKDMVLGSHKLTAVIYSEPKGEGEQGNGKSISFTVIDSTPVTETPTFAVMVRNDLLDNEGPVTRAYADAQNLPRMQEVTQAAFTDSVDDPDDPGKKYAELNEADLKNAAIKRYPDANASGILMLDWESKYYRWMMDLPANDPRFIIARDKYVRCIDVVKSVRPNVLVGFYAIPFRSILSGQYASYNGWPDNNKHDYLLSRVGVISVSVYPYYVDGNIEVIEKNCEMGLYYGGKYNKPVYAYMHHRIHASNTAKDADATAMAPAGITISVSRLCLSYDTYRLYAKTAKDYVGKIYNNKLAGFFLWDNAAFATSTGGANSNTRNYKPYGVGGWYWKLKNRSIVTGKETLSSSDEYDSEISAKMLQQLVEA